jgi:hypothetical protein
MELLIVRSYHPLGTPGTLVVPGLTCAALSLPWVPNPNGPGGMPLKSCVPDGVYDLLPHDSAAHPGTYIMVNPGLGVYGASIPAGQNWGRTECLLHPGNKPSDVLGCTMLGASNLIWQNGFFVDNSVSTYAKLVAILGRTDTHRLIIRPHAGTSETYAEDPS